MRRTLIRAAIALTAAAVAATTVHAQDIPQVISPLRVETDHNGVNLVSGHTQLPMPVLSAPGASNLRFDRVQNAAPYVRGTINAAGGGTSTASFSVHTGSGTEAFRCNDFDCVSVTGTGSGFVQNSRAYRQAGTGAQWTFNLLHSNTGTNPRQQLYYGSCVTYPNGEVITYGYATAVYNGLTFYRPNLISSNLGYSISISYAVPVEQGPATIGWASPSAARLYGPGAQLIGRLTYSGDTIIDHGARADNDPAGRQFTCTGCSNTMGTDLEVNAGTTQLPTEGAPNLQVAQLSPTQRVVSSVVRDGVQWNYSYANLRFDVQSAGYWYDSITVTGPNSFSQTYNFGISDRRNVLTSIRDPINRTTNYGFDEAFRPTSVIYPEGNRVDMGYDEFGNVRSRTATPKLGSGLTAVTETAFYPTDDFSMCNTLFISNVRCYRPLWSRDALGRQTDYAYNDSGQLIERTDPADAIGDRRKTYITYTLSPAGVSRRTVVRVCGFGSTCGTPNEIRTEYDYWGETLLVAAERRIDAATGETLTTAYTYDAAGRMTSEDGPLAGDSDARYFRYDLYGRRTWEIGPVGADGRRTATRFAYRDSDDKVVTTERGTVPDASSDVLTVLTRTDVTYDNHRKPAREVVAAGNGGLYNMVQRTFEDSGRLMCEAQRMNPGNFGAIADNASCTQGPGTTPDRITHNYYDAAGQLLIVQRGVGTPQLQNYATYTYTPNGQRASLTDANGNRSEFRYDGFDRQNCLIFPSVTTPGGPGGNCSTGDFEFYTYDAVGNRTSLRKRDGSTLTYQFDNLNRMIAKIVPERAGLSAIHSQDVYYGYDVRNNLQTYARFGSANGEGIINTYDNFGRLRRTRQYLDGVTRDIDSNYDPRGRRSQMNYPEPGFFITYNYDGGDRLTLLRANGTDWLNGFSYNAPGTMLSDISYAGASAGYSHYGYDAIGRVNSIAHDVAAPAYDASSTYGYNAANQIVSRSRNNDNYAWTAHYNVSRNYSVNGLNQYTAAGGATFTYDANGNLTSDGSTTYVYDVENRLVQATGATTAYLRYDPLGRLYETHGNLGTTRFLYDGDALVAEYNSAGALSARFVHGSNAAADDPLVWYYGGAPFYLRTDHQGSIVSVSDAAGNLQAINSYDEWGIPASTNLGRFQYAGQAWIPELGMYYYKARVYSPTLGRFLQTDPVGYEDQVNLYAYVGNDPVNRVDPTGMWTCANKESQTQCNVVSASLAQLRGLLPHLSGSVLRQANAILGAYGADNTTNGVQVRAGGSTPMSTSTSNGITTITMRSDIRSTSDLQHATGSSAAGAIGHEGDHIINERVRLGGRDPRTRQEWYNSERRAYTIQGLIDRGMRFQGFGATGGQYPLWQESWRGSPNAVAQMNYSAQMRAIYSEGYCSTCTGSYYAW